MSLDTTFEGLRLFSGMLAGVNALAFSGRRSSVLLIGLIITVTCQRCFHHC